MEKGFSLLEMIMVVMVAGAVVLLIANLPTSNKLVGNSKYESIAKEIASKKIDDLRDTTYDNLVDGVIEITDPRFSNLPDGNGRVTVSACPVEICTNGELIKKVDVVISWSDTGVQKIASVSSLIAKDGLK